VTASKLKWFNFGIEESDGGSREIFEVFLVTGFGVLASEVFVDLSRARSSGFSFGVPGLALN